MLFGAPAWLFVIFWHFLLHKFVCKSRRVRNDNGYKPIGNSISSKKSTASVTLLKKKKKQKSMCKIQEENTDETQQSHSKRAARQKLLPSAEGSTAKKETTSESSSDSSEDESSGGSIPKNAAAAQPLLADPSAKATVQKAVEIPESARTTAKDAPADSPTNLKSTTNPITPPAANDASDAKAPASDEKASTLETKAAEKPKND
uniref:Uncharacterized protein n=1 Tax=Steinernema glaseri TaxID=37863 RepID=A0A1I8ASH3_9BILA